MENVAWHGLSLHTMAVWDDKPQVSSRAMGHPIRRRLAVLAKCHRQLPTPKVSAAPHYPSTPASSGARRLAVLPCHMGANLAC